MKRRNNIIILIGFLLSVHNLFSQEPDRDNHHRFSMKSTVFQIKDEFNCGLVYSGAALSLEYGFMSVSEKTILDYSSELIIGIDSEKGKGIDLGFKPADLYYGFRITDIKKFQLSIGPYFEGYYNAFRNKL